MAVAEMSVMTLIGLKSEKNAILDEMQKCGAVQLRSAKEYPLTETLKAEDVADTDRERSLTEKAIGIISSAVEELPKAEKGEKVVKDGFTVTKDEFFAVYSKRERLMQAVFAVIKSAEVRAEKKAEITKIKTQIASFEPYLSVKEKFSEFKNTRFTLVYFGTVPRDKVNEFSRSAEEKGLPSFVMGEGGSEVAVCLFAHKSLRQEAEDVLSFVAFKKCNFTDDCNAEERVEQLRAKIDEIEKESEAELRKIAEKREFVKDLKLYSDYLAFLTEKANASEKFGSTSSVFIMEGYVPSEAKGVVEEAARRAATAVFTEFKPVPRDEFAPTLNKNGKAVSNFETVTNLYSAPAYGALDPNAVMSFFFSLFMGLIMADVGYGLLMIVGGFLFAKKQREGSTLAKMAKVFAIGGIFAVLFGALFDGWLGYPLLRETFKGYKDFYEVYLDPINSLTTVAGISVPSILMWCLALGTIHIGVGQILKAAQSFSRKRVFEGIFGGIVWAIAMFALVVFVYGMATGNSPMQTYGGYVTVGAVGIGVLTAGVGEKGFGKVIKPFTSLYGLINYVSDILSYARLYGLMLSGAQIASIFTNKLAIEMLFPTGIGGKIAGVLLIIVGNLFNLAINLLGAYIHDARLQYVEFYGKFYEGEGELFTPFGNTLEHAYFK